MRLASFTTSRGPSWGVVIDDHVVDLGLSRPELGWPTMAAALARADFDIVASAAQARRSSPVAVSDLELLPVSPDPGKILCVGLNYERHRVETGRDRTAYPVIFTRFSDSIVGAEAPLVRPAASLQFDFEGELAVVIGRGGRCIPEHDALAHVAGVACFNDGSIRDFQSHTHQFTPGKNFPNTGALGPWLVTLGEVGDLRRLTLTTRLNGTVVQQAPLNDLTFSIPEIITYCSTWTALRPGDIIATGTPGGVGARRTPPVWIAPGDTCEVEIDGVALLRNHVTAEQPCVSLSTST